MIEIFQVVFPRVEISNERGKIMNAFAKTEEGNSTLKELSRMRKMTPYQRDLYEQVKDIARQALDEDPEKAKELLALLKSRG